MDIYFAGSISGGRDDVQVYAELIDHLKRYGTVLTEHIADPRLTQLGEQLFDQEVHNRDLAWLCRSDVVVAEVSTPSFGVGYEIAHASFLHKPILCLHRPQPGKRLSGMVRAAPGVRVYSYQSLSEVRSHIDAFFAPLCAGKI